LSEKLPRGFVSRPDRGLKESVFDIKIDSHLVPRVHTTHLFLYMSETCMQGFMVRGGDGEFIPAFEDLGNPDGNLFAGESELDGYSVKLTVLFRSKRVTVGTGTGTEKCHALY
jgi:hypothetical protein